MQAITNNSFGLKVNNSNKCRNGEVAKVPGIVFRGQASNTSVNQKDLLDGVKAFYLPKKVNSPVSFQRSTYDPVLPEKLKPLEKYIQLFQDTKLQNLVISVLKETPDEFFRTPPTPGTAGHPSDENGKDGMYKHIGKTFVTAYWAAKRYGIEHDSKLINAVKVAALLHDTPFRFIKGSDHKTYVNPNHAVDNAKYVEAKMNELGIDKETTELVCAAIGLHMGRWDKHEDKEWLERFKHFQDHPVVKCIQEADFYSSRRNISVNPHPGIIQFIQST